MNEHARHVLVELQAEHGLSQLEAVRALRMRSAELLIASGLPVTECADHIARIAKARPLPRAPGAP